jgi:hypothetical protein
MTWSFKVEGPSRHRTIEGVGELVSLGIGEAFARFIYVDERMLPSLGLSTTTICGYRPTFGAGKP